MECDFPISSDASARIAELIRWGEQGPAANGLLPSLFLVRVYRMMDRDDRTVELYSHPHIDVGWYPPETLSAAGFDRLTVAGITIFADPGVTEHLKGKQLILHWANVGVPTPSSKTRQFLAAAEVAVDEGQTEQSKTGVG